MKTPRFSAEFEKMVQQYPYIFHVHTDFTDGRSSVGDYCRFALDNGYKYLIFTEHVRRVCHYNFSDLAHAVEDARHDFAPLRVSLGVEAKILPGGNLDVSDEILEGIDVLGIACHSFPSDVEMYAEAMEHVLKESYAEDLVRIWLHPGLFFKRTGIMDSRVFSYLLHLGIQQGVYVEYNIKYGLPPVDVQSQIPPQRKVLGVDGHSVRELKNETRRLC